MLCVLPKGKKNQEKRWLATFTQGAVEIREDWSIEKTRLEGSGNLTPGRPRPADIRCRPKDMTYS